MDGLRTGFDILLIGEDPALSAALHDAGFVVQCVPEGADLYATCQQHEPAAILLRADSPSRDTLEHLANLSRKFPQPTLVLHNGEDAELGQLALKLGFSAYVTEGMSAAVIKALVEVSISQRQQVQTLRQELARSQRSLAQRKLVDAAKCALMERHSLTEKQAFERLRQGAMQARQNLLERAREVMQLEESGG